MGELDIDFRTVLQAMVAAQEAARGDLIKHVMANMEAMLSEQIGSLGSAFEQGISGLQVSRRRYWPSRIYGLSHTQRNVWENWILTFASSVLQTANQTLDMENRTVQAAIGEMKVTPPFDSGFSQSGIPPLRYRLLTPELEWQLPL
jgi:hypothetical protein